jgi:hypothetical protein
MDSRQLSMYSESELAKMISPAFSRKKNQAEWNLRVNRLGAVRADLSKDLLLSEEGCPTILPYFGIPEYPLINFKEALSTDNYDYWVHFFIDDVFFEQIWNPKYSERDIEILRRFRGMFTPDFTLDPRLSQWQERFNVFRSRAIGQLVQRKGGIVIPTVGWSFRRSFDYCFCGLSEGGTVAISTNGILNNYVSLRLFKEGVFELERQLRPETIFIYGSKIELRTKARQIWHPNTQIMHLRNQDANDAESALLRSVRRGRRKPGRCASRASP